jgi:hypothetical protein
MKPMNKSLKADVEYIVLVQQEGRGYDLIYMFLNAPPPMPDDEEAEAVFVSFAAEGYGGVWLKKAFDLQPDEVVNAEEQSQRLVNSASTNAMLFEKQ